MTPQPRNVQFPTINNNVVDARNCEVEATMKWYVVTHLRETLNFCYETFEEFKTITWLLHKIYTKFSILWR